MTTQDTGEVESAEKLAKRIVDRDWATAKTWISNIAKEIKKRDRQIVERERERYAKMAKKAMEECCDPEEPVQIFLKCPPGFEEDTI